MEFNRRIEEFFKKYHRFNEEKIVFAKLINKGVVFKTKPNNKWASSGYEKDIEGYFLTIKDMLEDNMVGRKEVEDFLKMIASERIRKIHER
jgi:hypothetical protein